MKIELNNAQQTAQREFRAFVDKHIAPYANDFDREERIPGELIQMLGERGFLGALVPAEYDGRAMDMLTWGLLCEAIGRGSASVISLLTVHNMVIQALVRWGSEEQRKAWLPRLATGETIAAFGLTEPNIGSDAANTETAARPDGKDFIIDGVKRWISFGQAADLFLILCQVEGKSTALLVERNRDGFRSEAITGMLGFRSAMLAELHLQECRVPATNVVGRIGFGFSHVAGTALDHGRYCVGWGALGLIQGCVDACLEYVGKRKQFGAFLKKHQLIQEMIANMLARAKAARLMCYHAASLAEQNDPAMIIETSIAKYFTSREAVKVALDAVQIHGANGCSDEYPVARYMRDAKILEIIEGSNQIQQIIIAKCGYQEHIINKRLRRSRKGDENGA